MIAGGIGIAYLVTWLSAGEHGGTYRSGVEYVGIAGNGDLYSLEFRERRWWSGEDRWMYQKEGEPWEVVLHRRIGEGKPLPSDVVFVQSYLELLLSHGLQIPQPLEQRLARLGIGGKRGRLTARSRLRGVATRRARGQAIRLGAY